MSRTKRKDHYIEKHGEPIFGDEWKATSDRKKWYKPSKKAKYRDEQDSEIRILRVKNSHIPLFEVASKGISYSSMKSKFNFTEQEPLVSQDLLLEFMKNHRIPKSIS